MERGQSHFPSGDHTALNIADSQQGIWNKQAHLLPVTHLSIQVHCLLRLIHLLVHVTNAVEYNTGHNRNDPTSGSLYCSGGSQAINN